MLGGGAAIALLLGGAGFWFWKRRESEDEDDDDGDFVEDRGTHARFDLIADLPPAAPEPGLAPPAPVAAAPAPRPEPESGPPPKRGAHAMFDLIADLPPAAPDDAVMRPESEPMAPPPQSEPDLGPPPKRGAHAIFDLGAVASPEPAQPESAVPETAVPEAAAPETSSGPTVPMSAPVPGPPPSLPPEAITAPAIAAGTRATLDLEMRPKRAGTNLMSAAVDYEIVVRNTGGASAHDIQLDVRLLSAGAEQDGWIGALFSSPIERSITAPFDLPPGGAIELTGMAMIPKEMLSVMNVQGRALFVPVLAVNLLYGWDGGEGQTATSHVVGIDRGEGAKMAPFRLDGGPRMFEGVSQLPYTVSVRR
ncbi:MAG: hypothetical protein JWN66_195 [Sphingomonas bacterium]|nr:hypothetical protein [Sphingomonas bacterium]